MKITADNGYFFGLGVFETMDIIKSHCVFLPQHLERLNNSLAFFEIDKTITAKDINKYLKEHSFTDGVLKITVSAENTIFTTRENLYAASIGQTPYRLTFSEVLRNETSEFTYHKTLNCGDNITEKAKAVKKGFDEAIFINTKGEIAEGATSNIFFVKNRGIFTPTGSSGLLQGVMRKYLIKKYDVTEMIITPQVVNKFDECFITNSLMGITPVSQLEGFDFGDTKTACNLQAEYKERMINL